MALSSRDWARLVAARARLAALDTPAPSIAAVARDAALSTDHFIRRFTAVFGETPHRWRTRERISAARTMLATGDDRVTDVCLALGFTSIGSFGTRFAREVGCAPLAYRRRVFALGALPPSHPRSLVAGCLSLMGALPVGTWSISEKRREDAGG